MLLWLGLSPRARKFFLLIARAEGGIPPVSRRPLPTGVSGRIRLKLVGGVLSHIFSGGAAVLHSEKSVDAFG